MVLGYKIPARLYATQRIASSEAHSEEVNIGIFNVFTPHQY